VALLAVFAVSAVNLQPAGSRFPQKSWAADDWASEITARAFAVLSLFFAVCETLRLKKTLLLDSFSEAFGEVFHRVMVARISLFVNLENIF
jgi:hypothetical protein